MTGTSGGVRKEHRNIGSGARSKGVAQHLSEAAHRSTTAQQDSAACMVCVRGMHDMQAQRSAAQRSAVQP